MNQQLLNINTVINPDSNIDTLLTATSEDFNSPLRLEKITSIVNNNNNAPATLRYKIIRYLGQGVRGNLYLALDSKGRRVICKEIQLDANPSNNALQTQQLEFELNILKYLSNNTVAREHVNPCLDYKIHNDHVYTIFPVFKGYSLGNFYGYMVKLPTQDAKQDAKQDTTHDAYYKIAFVLIKSLLHALAKIHDAGIAHQNITHNSILVSTFIAPDEIKVKFTDFGLGCGCSKDPYGNFQSQDQSNPKSANNTMVPWQQYQQYAEQERDIFNKIGEQLGDKIGNCKDNGHVPVKYMKEVLLQLKNSDYLKISQKYDVLCLGLIIIKFLLYFDSELVSIIDNLFLDNMNNSKLQILRDMIKSKYLDNNYLLDNLFISNDDKKLKKLIVEYLKFIWKYMIAPTVKRRTAQYVIDKIIIYEKYKNDIF